MINAAHAIGGVGDADRCDVVVCVRGQNDAKRRQKWYGFRLDWRAMWQRRKVSSVFVSSICVCQNAHRFRVEKMAIADEKVVSCLASCWAESKPMQHLAQLLPRSGISSFLVPHLDVEFEYHP